MKHPQLTRQLVLQTRQRTPDGTGGFTDTWVDLGQLWAEIHLRSGRETNGRAQARYRITTRAAQQGNPERPVAGQRFREGDRVFRIETVSETDASGRYLTCFSTEERAL